MGIYILNCDKLNIFKTFKSIEDVLSFLHKINDSHFDGEPFSIFGRGQKLIGVNEYIDSEYYVDSVVLCPKGKRNEYYT
jgi:hypothetical protein